MSCFKPVAVISHSYDWEADGSVLETLVFMDPGIDTEMTSPEKKAVFKLRAVKESDGTYKALIRNGGEKPFIIHEFPIKFGSDFLAMHYLIDWLEQCFEVRQHRFNHVPDQKVD